MMNLTLFGPRFRTRLAGASVLCLGVFTNASFSYAALGGTSSGGGQGIVCRNDDGTVASAKLLDLAEAEDYFLLTLQTQPHDRAYLEIAHDYAAILDNSMPATSPIAKMTMQSGNLPPQTSYDINPGVILAKQNNTLFTRTLVDQIDSGKMLIPGNNFKLPPVGDSTPLVLPSSKNCSIEQIAVYTDASDQVHFVGSVWNQLDNVNKAALLIHEALYRSLREFGDTTSDNTRRTNAYLFSGLKFEWILDGLPQKYLYCWTNEAAASFQFVVYLNGSDSVTAQFLIYNGQLMLTKTTTSLNTAPFAAAAFGLTTPSITGEVGFVDTLSNPLVDVPNYSFVQNVAPATGAVNSTIEAYDLVAGLNPKQVTCNNHLSSITYGPNGQVGVGFAQTP